MQRRIFHAGICVTCVFLIGIGFYRTAAAQSPEEMQTLRLFYKEKDLVVSATRHPKPVSQVAENITVITAKEIEEMNAHSVAGALARVPGLFVNFNQDFGATSLIGIQGSEQRHVLVMVDGIPWNFLSEGSAETNTIPIGIVERIEIIKGPASSAWGSSLGGVINILTKPAGSTEKPTGSIRASAGERHTSDTSAQVAGLAGPLGYYLFAGRQESDGLRDARKFDSTSIFSKFSLSPTENVDLGLTVGFSKPRNKIGDFPDSDITTSLDARSFFTSASLDAALTPELDLNVSLYTVEQKSTLITDTLGLGIISTDRELFSNNIVDEQTYGGRGKLVWSKGIHTAVLGIDADRGNLDQTLQNGTFLQLFGTPAISVSEPALTRWALYANDTITLDRFSLTPGIRYDDNSIIGTFVSPSLGATYRWAEHTVARASVARGFTMPPLAWTSVGGFRLDPNPSLKPESVWSYQAGLESSAVRYLWIKGTVFQHDLDNEIVRQNGAAGPPTFNALFVNRSGSRRRGLELEAETVPFHDLSLAAGFAYVKVDSASEAQTRNRYTGTVGFKYDDRQALQAQLLGHYIWWDLPADNQGDYSDWIWDLNLSRKILETKQYVAKLFFTGHNLLNGDQYQLPVSRNPQRWVEAGVNFTF